MKARINSQEQQQIQNKMKQQFEKSGIKFYVPPEIKNNKPF